jgi:thiamine phosphate synthase YjbQ (UPF0047 family)
MTSHDGRATFVDLTDLVCAVVDRSGVAEGLVSVFSPHTTCAVITQEAALDLSMTGLETLQQDFIDALARIMPDQTREGIYLHPGPQAIAFAAEHDEPVRQAHNTDAHLRSALIGRSETIPVRAGRPGLGEFGRIYFVDFDMTRSRQRRVDVTVLA